MRSELLMLLRRTVGTSLGLLLMAALFAVPTSASDDDFGAFIRTGSCDSPGDVVEDVGDLDDLDADDSEWKLVSNDAPDGVPVYGEDEGISQSIDELRNADHIVTVHATDDQNADVIACGSITGDLEADGSLRIDLEAVNDSGYAGVVYFEKSNDKDDATEVTTAIWQGGTATPVASPTT